MRLNILLTVAALFSGYVLADEANNESIDKITKLLPISLLGEYGKKNRDSKAFNEVNRESFKPIEDPKGGVELNDQAQVTIQGFLDNTNENTVSALFIVLGVKDREIIQDLLRKAGDDHDMKTVQIFQLSKVKEMIHDLLKEGDNVEEIKALLIVRDNKAKEIIEELLTKNANTNEVKVVLVGEDQKAKNIIQKFLEKKSLSDKKKIELEQKQEEYNMAKTEQAKELIKTMFNTQQSPKLAKDMIQSLLGRDEKVKEIISFLPKEDTRTKEMMQGLLGLDEKVQNILNTFMSGFVNTGFVIKGDKDKDIDAYVIKQDTGKIVNDGLFYQTEGEIRCGLASYKEDTEKTHQLMEDFFLQLKSFNLESTFDYRKFELMGRGLENHLVKLEERVGRVVICSPKLTEELSFAKVKFQTMVESIDILKYYETTEFPGHMLIYFMTDLNVRLLFMRDLRGKPDLLMNGYVAKLRDFFQLMNFWNDQFKKFDHILFGPRMFFRKQFEIAETTLITLARGALK